MGGVRLNDRSLGHRWVREPGRAPAPVRIFSVNRMGASIVELETGYIPRQAAQNANEINVQLSSNLVARAGMAEAELK